MTTTDHAAMLAAICQDPDDDTVRRAYADYLDELPDIPCPCCKDATFDTGDCGGPMSNPKMASYLRSKCSCGGSGRDTTNHDRAEFIRVQCELWNVGPAYRGIKVEGMDWSHPSYSPTCKRAASLAQRSNELLRLHADTWRPEVLRWKRGVVGQEEEFDRYVVEVEYVRGFVGRVKLRTEDFLRDHERRIDAGECPECSKDRPGWKRYTRQDYPEGKPSGYKRPRIRVTCKACSGTKRRTLGDGFAARLFRSVPVQRVTLSDKEPVEAGHYEEVETYGRIKRDWVYWGDDEQARIILRDTYQPRPFNLPKVIYSRLPNGELFMNGMYYPTPELAHTALSDACVAWGREMAFGASEKGKRV